MASRNGTRLCGKFPTPRPMRGIWGGSDSVDDDESLTMSSVVSGELAALLFVGEMISDPTTVVIDDKSAPRNSIVDSRAYFIFIFVFTREIKRFLKMEYVINEMHRSEFFLLSC